MNNTWIPMASLRPNPPACEAYGVSAAREEWEVSLNSLTSAADVACNDTSSAGRMPRRRALQQSLHDSVETSAPSSSSPQDHGRGEDRFSLQNLVFENAERSQNPKEKFRKLLQQVVEEIEGSTEGSSPKSSASAVAHKLLVGYCAKRFSEWLIAQKEEGNELRRANFKIAYGSNPVALGERRGEFVAECGSNWGHRGLAEELERWARERMLEDVAPSAAHRSVGAVLSALARRETLVTGTTRKGREKRATPRVAGETAKDASERANRRLQKRLEESVKISAKNSRRLRSQSKHAMVAAAVADAAHKAALRTTRRTARSNYVL